jgi:hypothetical protein
MKRFLMLVGVAVIAAAMYVAASPASQQSKGPTLKQFNALKAKVAGLSKTVKAEKALLTACVKVAIPINQFGNPQPTDQSTPEGYEYGKGTITTPTSEFFTTGLDVSSPTDTGAVWFVGGDATCGTALGESALRHGATKGKLRFAGGLSHLPLFSAHH